MRRRPGFSLKTDYQAYSETILYYNKKRAAGFCDFLFLFDVNDFHSISARMHFPKVPWHYHG